MRDKRKMELDLDKVFSITQMDSPMKDSSEIILDMDLEYLSLILFKYIEVIG